jgi:hypothetical protein
VNPDNSGGSSEIAIFGSTVYFTNQSASTISIAPVTASGFTATTLPVDLGARALTVDSKDKLLVIVNEGSGTLTLIDLTTNQIVGHIDAVSSESENSSVPQDNRNDRDQAGNLPVVSSVAPNTIKQGATVAVVITGKNLTGATGLLFVDPGTLPGKGKGRGNGNSGNHSHGPFGSNEAGITTTNIQVNSAGTQLTATVNVAAKVSKGDFVVRVSTPNGESSFVSSPANILKVN